MDIKIIVATHKPYWMPKDDVYLPLQVGAEGKPSLGFAKDNTGDNISIKNPNFCELTGLYWAWKNLDCEYIGLCHYRRYFARKPKGSTLEDKQQAILRQNEYEKLLQDCDVILPAKRNYYIETVRSHYEHAHNKRDLDEVETIINTRYPEYSEAFAKVMRGTRLYAMATNNGSSIATDGAERIERYRFAFRNENYLYRQEGIFGFMYYFAKCGVNILRILSKAPNRKLYRCSIILECMLKGLFFNPAVEKV